MTVEELMHARREFYSALDTFKSTVKEYCIERSLSTKLVFADKGLDAFLSMVRLIINSTRPPVPANLELPKAENTLESMAHDMRKTARAGENLAEALADAPKVYVALTAEQIEETEKWAGREVRHAD